MSNFTVLMTALARELNIANEIDGNHTALQLDDLLYDFYYDEATTRLLLVTMVGDLGENPSPQRQAVIFKQLMKSQFCFGETTGFTFGLSNNDEFIALQALWNISNMQEREFLGLVEKFVQTARLWSNKLATELSSDSASEEYDASFDSLNHIRG